MRSHTQVALDLIPLPGLRDAQMRLWCIPTGGTTCVQAIRERHRSRYWDVRFPSVEISGSITKPRSRATREQPSPALDDKSLLDGAADRIVERVLRYRPRFGDTERPVILSVNFLPAETFR